MKILLKKKDEKGLFLFVGNGMSFVVATLISDTEIGQSVESWWHGTYFSNIDDVLNFLDSCR